MTNWIEWRGGKCPLPDGTEVEIQAVNNMTTVYVTPNERFEEFWRHETPNSRVHIVRYRVLKEAQPADTAPEPETSPDTSELSLRDYILNGISSSNEPSTTLSLRDQFAIAALPTVIAVHAGDYDIKDFKHDFMAEQSYLIADAMMKAREGGQ